MLNTIPVTVNLREAPWAGWAEDGRAVAEAGDDARVLPEFANEDDADLQ